MAIITRAIPENAQARATMGGSLPSTLGETLSAVISDPLLRPTQMSFQQREIGRESGARNAGGIFGVDVIGSVRDIVEEPPELLAPEDLNAEFGNLGLEFDRPVSRDYAELLAEGKRNEAIRADVIARGPTGFGATTAKFGAALAGAAIDPLNVASAFIPVVSQARYAGLVAKMGKTGARATTGMVEGFVGAAAIEPITYGLASQQQLDYEMSDALVNVGLGGFLGGGLHVVGGKLSDLISARSPEVRESALRSSVSQLMEGKRVDVDPVFKFDDEFSAPIRPVQDVPPSMLSEYDKVVSGEVKTFADAAASNVRAMEMEIEGLRKSSDTLGTFIAKRGGLNREIMRAEGVDPDVFKDKQKVFGQPLFRKEGGRTPDEVAEMLNEMGFEGGGHTANSVVDMVFDVANGRDRFMDLEVKGKVDALQNQVDALSRSVDERYLERVYTNVVESDLDFEATVLRRQEEQANAEANARLEAAEITKNEARPERDITADFEAAARIREFNDSGIGDDLGAEVEFSLEEVEVLRAAGLIDKADEAALKVVESEIAHAEGYARGAQAAARCLLR